MAPLSFDSDDTTQDDPPPQYRKRKLPLPSELDDKIKQHDRPLKPLEETGGSHPASGASDQDDYLKMEFKAELGPTYEEEFEQAKLEKLIPDKRKRQLHTSLNTSLFDKGEESKGLSMMRKMGFKVEDMQNAPKPIELNLKSGRAGIGFESEKKRKLEQAVAAEFDREKQRRENFSMARKAEEAEKHLKSTLHRAQHTLLDLDATSRNIDPTEIWELWKPIESDVLYRELVLEHQIRKHESEARKRQMYGQSPPDEQLHLYKEDPNLLEFMSRDLDKQLRAVNSRLRQAYCYCVFCGHRYADATDLAENCPGETEDDHN
jgi:hypothetical protein